jgi:hypothetical protein
VSQFASILITGSIILAGASPCLQSRKSYLKALQL